MTLMMKPDTHINQYLRNCKGIEVLLNQVLDKLRNSEKYNMFQQILLQDGPVFFLAPQQHSLVLDKQTTVLCNFKGAVKKTLIDINQRAVTCQLLSNINIFLFILYTRKYVLKSFRQEKINSHRDLRDFAFLYFHYNC